MGILDRFFRPRPANMRSSVMTPEHATRIVQDYGAALVSAAPAPGCVADSRKLPHPKESIKQALLFALSVTKDAKTRDQLKVGYISLADWQDGVGDVPVGLNISAMDLSADTDELAKQVLSQSAGFEKWNRLVQQEQAELKAELEKLRLW